jgi:ketosteroid isomerase-like protein
MNETENSKLVESGYDFFGNGDIEGLLKLFTDDIKWTVPEIENAPFAGSRSGKSDVGNFFQQLSEAEDISEFVPKEFVAQGDKVVVLGRSKATARATGKTYETDWVHVFTLRDGKVAEFHEFFDNAAATKAFQMTAAAK